MISDAGRSCLVSPSLTSNFYIRVDVVVTFLLKTLSSKGTDDGFQQSSFGVRTRAPSRLVRMISHIHV